MEYSSNSKTQTSDSKINKPVWIIRKLNGVHKVHYIYNIVALSYTFLYFILSLIFYIEKKTDPTCWINISMCIVGTAIVLGGTINSIIAYINIKKMMKDNKLFNKVYLIILIQTAIGLCLMIGQHFVIRYTDFKLAVMSCACSLILLDVFAAIEKVWSKYFISQDNKKEVSK